MIAIIDYGAGNLQSVKKAFDYLGVETTVTADPQVLNSAAAAVLPGVGAFGDAMAALHSLQLEEPIRRFIEQDKPFLGICLGMQCMVIEYARNVLGLKDANSTEMNPQTPYNVIDLMEEQKSISNMGGTMRLGAYDCVLKAGSKAAEAYGSTHISERHRHRFEFNEEFRKQFEDAGMKCVGENPDTHLVEVVELPEKKWYIGTQYHPEYSSTVLSPNPLFLSFVKAAIDNQKK